MLKPHLFTVEKNTNAPHHILCLGAHCDDIEIGCGGALLTLLDECPDIEITWVVFTSTEVRKREAELGAKLFTEKAKNLHLKIFDFRDGFLPYSGLEVKEALEEVKREIRTPDLIFTHYRNDLHQDHRIISELTGNTFRNHLTFEYEIPKWDGDIGNPNTFITIDKKTAKKKIELLQKVYNSQNQKSWFTDDLFHSIMRIRGMESNSPSNLAEGFYTRKTIFKF